MKKLLSIFAALAFAFSARAQIVTAGVTITNAPVNGSTLTIQGNTFIWTNGTPVGSFAVLITNTFGGDATNLATAATNTIAQLGITVANGGSNIVQFSRSVLLNTNYTTNWASVVLTTNGGAAPTVIVAPIGGGGMAAAQQTNAESQLVSDIDVNSTNAIDQTAPVASQLVGTTNAQNITGAKTFSYRIAVGSNSLSVSNVFEVSATNHQARAFAVTTNGITQMDGGRITTDGFGDLNLPVGGVTALGFFTVPGLGIFNDGGVLFGGDGSGGITSNTAYLNIFVQAGNTPQSILRFYDPAGGLTYNAGSGNIVGGGTADGILAVRVFYSQSSRMTNMTTAGTNALNGLISYPRYDNSAMSAVNQDINLGTNVYVKLSGSGTASTNAGFLAGQNGEHHFIELQAGFNVTIADDSGLDSTPANRIFTPKRADMTLTNTLKIIEVIYDSSVSRWKMIAPANP